MAKVSAARCGLAFALALGLWSSLAPAMPSASAALPRAEPKPGARDITGHDETDQQKRDRGHQSEVEIKRRKAQALDSAVDYLLEARSRGEAGNQAAVFLTVVEGKLYMADPREPMVLSPKLEEVTGSEFAMTIAGAHLDGRDVIVPVDFFAAEYEGRLIDPAGANLRVLAPPPGSAPLPVERKRLRDGDGKPFLRSYAKVDDNVFIAAGDAGAFGRFASKAPFKRSDRAVLSLTTDKVANVTLQRELSRSELQSATSKADLEAALRKLSGKNVVAFGHVERRSNGDENFVIYRDAARTDPLFIISFGELAVLAKRFNVKIFPYGCNTARPGGAGTLNPINPEQAAPALVTAFKAASERAFYRSLALNANTELVVSRDDFTDSKSRLTIRYYESGRVASPSAPSTTYSLDPLEPPPPFDWTPVVVLPVVVGVLVFRVVFHNRRELRAGTRRVVQFLRSRGG